jgi:hypothetical protein
MAVSLLIHESILHENRSNRIEVSSKHEFIVGNARIVQTGEKR